MRDWLGWLGVGDQLGLKDIERDHVVDAVGQGLRLPEALRDAVGAADRSQSPCLWDALRWEVVTKKRMNTFRCTKWKEHGSKCIHVAWDAPRI